MPLAQTLTRTLLPAHAPALRLLATEPWRALREYVEHHRRALDHLPRGDGHPVVVFPGLASDELALRPLGRCTLMADHQTSAVPLRWSCR